jgi:hypothetical protein
MAVNDPTKFRQIYNLENRLYVEADYENIILIDPNKVVNGSGTVEDRYVQQENLVMYANLETKIIPRTKLAVGDSFDTPVNNTSIASLSSNDEDLNINFLKPKGKNYFDTSWSDEFTGKGSRQGQGINQNQQYSTTENGITKTKSKVLNYEDTQNLGIKNITVKISSIGVPTVDMILTDVRGRALFEQGDNSIYSVFFNLPYPTFYLTLKGYYGKAIRYQLTLLSFNAKFDPGTGNFDISLKLMGRNSAILADSIISFAKYSPKMFTTQVITQAKSSSSSQTGNNKSSVSTQNDTVGLQKLREVYSVYKTKKLISEDFPEITMEEFIFRTNKYEETIQNKIKQGDFNVVNDINSYQTTLNDLRQSIYINSINDFLDTGRRLVYDGVIYYPYSNDLDDTKKEETRNRTKTKFDELTQKLKQNPSFGEKGEYILPSSTQSTKKTTESGKIDVKIKFDNILKQIDYNNVTNDDFKTTYEVNFGRTPSDEELQKYISEFKSFNVATQTIINSQNQIEQTIPTYYTFGEIPNTVNNFKTDSFLALVQKMNSTLDEYRNKIEQALTNALSDLISSEDGGLGFQPTIRNVFAVLFAGLDGFYRMMEDTHTNAWNQRKNPTRLNSILPPTKQNVGVDSLGVVNGSFQLNNENTVYPWPQYFEKERQQDGTELYTIKYPGDANSLSVTQGYNNVIWPEIAFTEEFINASLQKSPPTVPQSTNNPKSNTESMSVNPIEFPFNTSPFINKTEVNFLYEILERSYLATHYSNIERGKYKDNQIDKILADIDGENIKTSLTNSPSYTLTNILKNFKPTYNQYLEYLKTTSSNGTGELWSNYLNSEYNTGYIKNYFLSDYNKIYSIDTLNGVSLSVGGNIPLIDKFKTYLNSTSTQEQYLLDPYPFNDVNWLKTNLEKGDNLQTTQDFYKTQTFSYLNDKKTIARVNQTETLTDINLFTNKYGFTNYNQSYITDQSNNVPVSSRATLKNFFNTRLLKDQYFTESFINYGLSYSGNVGFNQTTSLLNTPYFINALQRGVELEKTNVENPYVALGYLYLNSLPLITTKEKIKKTTNGQDPTDLDYLAATFNKFSAIHQLPYAWVLKYGSIWHRYKKYVDSGIDILNDVWKDFDYVTNYDPVTSAITTSYSGNWVGNIILQSSTTVPNTTNTNDIITMGFYPKVINDIYRYFYKTDLDILQNPTTANFQNESTENGLVVSNSYTRTFLPGFDITNPLRQLTIKNNYQYFKTPNGDTDNYLLVPSMGGLNINQAEYECFNDLDKITNEVFNNKALYNGSVRSLWGASNFGYFDNSLIKKPNYNEYLKTIYTDSTPQRPFELKNNQSSYSKIDEIFAVFEPKILDEFEKLFLNFCNPKDVISDMILLGEQTQATETTPGKVSNVAQKKLFSQIESLYILPKNAVTLQNQEIDDGKKLAEAQTKNFMSKIVEFLNFDCVLKMGNPGNFNRRTFNYFTNNTDFIPIGFVPNPPYVKGTLPGDGVLSGPNALLLSQAANGSEWNTLKKYVGDFDQDGIKYTNTGSSITSFFIDNDIEFTVSNIETLYPLIRLYAKEKLKDITFNKIKFTQLINTYVKNQNTFNGEVVNEIISYLNKNLDEVKVKTNTVNSSTSGNVVKLEYYTTLKTMNDKWIAGTDFKNKTIFEDFLFFDRANRDIGNEFTISVNDMETYLTDPNKNYLDLVSKILQANNFIFFAMPAYVNFYGIQEAVRQNKPVPVEIPSSMFGTYLDVDYIDSRPKFLCVYVGKPSEHVASEAKFVKFRDDAFDLKKYDNPLSTSYDPNTDFSKVNRVVGFSVDYGIQNQSIFKSVQLDMSEKKNTAESNKLITQLGDSASGNKVAQQTVSLYSIYKTRSYTCTIDCMGDAMIQPTMYFNLRHVPLFYGPYWIMEVNHSIGPGKFDTQFKGVRMPLYTLPKPNSLLESVQKNYVKYYKDLILQTLKTSDTTAQVNISEKIAPQTPGAIKGSESECQKFELEQYNKLPYVDLKTTQITENELFELISNTSVDTVLKPLYYGIVKTQALNSIDKNVISSFNYNLYGSGAFNEYTESLLTLVTGKVCATTALITTPYPYFNFNSYNDSLNFYVGVTQPYVEFINTWVDKSTETTQAKKYAQAYTVFTLFWDQTWYIKDGGGTGFYTTLPKQYIEFKQRFDEKIKPQNKNIYDSYLSYMKKYETAFKKFFG